MRAGLIGAVIAVGLMASSASAQAQSFDGPLAAPGEAPAAPKAAIAHAKPKPRKPAHHAKAKPAKDPAKDTETQDASLPHQAPGATPAARPGTPVDAIDLGMKWNGNNDGAAQTKFQSGPDTSAGSGAEVGMKLHF